MGDIFWMALCDFVRCMNRFSRWFYTTGSSNSIICTMRGFIIVFFSMSAWNWHFKISLNVLLTIKKWKNKKNLKMRIILHVVIWSISAVFAGLPIGHYVTNPRGLCVPQLSNLWMVMFMLPFFAALSFSLYVLSSLFLYLRKNFVDTTSRRMIIFRTFVFVAVFLVIYFPLAVCWILYSLDIIPVAYL